MTGAWAKTLWHPYQSAVKRRWGRQLLRYRPLLQAATRSLCALQEGPHPIEVAPLLTHAWDHAPYWRRRMRAAGLGRGDLGHPQALQALPPLTRPEVQAHGGAMVDLDAPRWVRDDYYRGVTSGSTGEPLAYVASGFQHLWYWAFVDFVLHYYGVDVSWRRGRLDAVLLSALDHSAGYGAWLPVFHGVRFRKVYIGDVDAMAAIARAQPAVVTGDPDSLRALLAWDLRPKLVLSSAFAMPPALRQALERHLGCPVVAYYSAAETGMIGVERRDRAGYAVLTPAVYVEREPSGEILVTNLRNPHFPLIRYRLGDRIQLDTSTRHSGELCAPVITALEGRARFRFRRADGRTWDPTTVQPVLARLGIERYTLVELGDGHVRLHFDGELKSAQRELLIDAIARYGGPHVVEWRRGRFEPERGAKPVPFVTKKRLVR